MIRQTYERRMFERIKEATGKLKTNTTPQITIPIGNENKVITEPDKIARILRDHNIQHFAQAKGCILSSKEFQEVHNKERFNKKTIDPDTSEWRNTREYKCIIHETRRIFRDNS